MNSPVIAVVGETASGKSDLAMRIARAHNGELICADSWTVRRELTIGTAKPSTDDQVLVPHHLLDIVDPDEDFTAAIFKQKAQAAIADIADRGKLPILVGGTGLYIDGVLFDYDFLPPGTPGQRAALNELDIPALRELIARQGIDIGDTDVRNKRRLIRLIETNGAAQTKQELRPNTLCIGLQPERAELTSRITQRVDVMIAAGLEDEVRAVAERYGWDCEGLKGIGYREWREYFLGSQDLATTRERIISSTVGLAKRQRTWFKRNKSIHWISTPVNYAQVDEMITTYLNN